MPRTPRRAARRAIWIERMPRWSVGGILVGRSEGELVEIRFANEDRSRLTQCGNRGGVGISHVVLPHTRCGCGCRAADVKQILDGDRHAVQGTAILASGDLAIRLPCLCARLVLKDGDEGVERSIALGDALQAPLEDHFGRGIARLQRARELRNRVRLSGHHRDSRLGIRDSKIGSPVASAFHSAVLSADVAFASPSSSGFNSGNPRRSAS